jgi:hypothetical protein
MKQESVVPVVAEALKEAEEKLAQMHDKEIAEMAKIIGRYTNMIMATVIPPVVIEIMNTLSTNEEALKHAKTLVDALGIKTREYNRPLKDGNGKVNNYETVTEFFFATEADGGLLIGSIERKFVQTLQGGGLRIEFTSKLNPKMELRSLDHPDVEIYLLKVQHLSDLARDLIFRMDHHDSLEAFCEPYNKKYKPTAKAEKQPELSPAEGVRPPEPSEPEKSLKTNPSANAQGFRERVPAPNCCGLPMQDITTQEEGTNGEALWSCQTCNGEQTTELYLPEAI